jgi:uncharacterized protein
MAALTHMLAQFGFMDGLVIAGWVLLLVLLTIITYVLTKYLPIISNMFLDVTINTRSQRDEPFEGETVRFKTSDGVDLAGTLSPGDAGQPVVVFCHEFSSDRNAASHYADFLLHAGCRIFTFDFRGHGDSEAPAKYVSRLWVTGAERADLRAALKYLHGRKDVNHENIGLFGVSRGGVVALCGATEDPSVKAVVTDGAYSAHRTLYDYMRKWVPIFARVRWVYQHHPDWFYRGLGWLAIKLSELRIRSRVVSLDKKLMDIRVPVLMVHGERDNYLDVTQARDLAGLNPEFIELWVVPKANHNEAVVAVADEYRRRLTDFFVAHLRVPVTEAGSRNLDNPGTV